MNNFVLSDLDIDKLKKQLKIREGDISFLSGSIIQNLGNSYSDLDVFIFIKDLDNFKDIDSTYEEKDVKTHFMIFDGFNLDIEYWNINKIKSFIASINSIEFKDNSLRTRNLIKEVDLSLIHRMIIGLPITEKKQFNVLRDSLNMENYFKISIRYRINIIDNMYEDITGNYEDGNLKTSYIACRKAIINSVYTYLLYKKISLDREKWALKLLERLAITDNEANDILQKVEQLLIYNSINNDLELKKTIEKGIDLINLIIDKIQMNGEGI